MAGRMYERGRPACPLLSCIFCMRKALRENNDSRPNPVCMPQQICGTALYVLVYSQGQPAAVVFSWYARISADRRSRLSMLYNDTSRGDGACRPPATMCEGSTVLSRTYAVRG